ncbi:MAG: S46 family peptidase [Ignavibacteriales bacterium]
MKPKITVKNYFFSLLLALLVIGCSANQVSQNSIYYPKHFDLDTIKAKKFDTGKMWTFENAPLDYFDKTYSFRPTQEWLDDVRLSALKFANWCSASFVSEDGLILTNHHCVDFITDRFQNEGENIKNNGFYATTMEEERKVPDLFVDQLALIQDVTDEVIKAYNQGKDPKESTELKNKKIKELEENYSKETGLICKVTSLYNGGKFSLYGYKRYNDIRAVYVNESDMGLWGGDPDNFTYPRYGADFAFMRAYDENGKPLKTEHFFKFSETGAQPDEPLFVVGNPGSTQRLKTIAQLEYYRDFTYRNNAFRLKGMVDNMYELMREYPDKAEEIKNTLFMITNSEKVNIGIYKTLIDPVFFARKKAFEKEFKAKVMAKPELAKKYGHIWEGIERTRAELRMTAPERSAFKFNPRMSPVFFNVANNLIEYAEQMKLPEEKRAAKYQKKNLDSTIVSIFPEKIDMPAELKKIRLQADVITLNMGTDDLTAQKFTGGKKYNEAVNFVKSKSVIMSEEGVLNLVRKGPDAILNSDDPFISIILSTRDRIKELDKKANEIQQTEMALEDQLGQALYEVYGVSIPPDATFTLRISDGVMKSYEYNGTVAPLYSTFYGMLDRYYSNNGEYPWNLPERWANPSEDFDPSTPFNFISTNDIVGGNSGSAVINKNAEVVGAAFDGNIESLEGSFLYDQTSNRTVSVASQAILEILENVTNAKRIVAELKAGKIQNPKPAENLQEQTIQNQ